MTFSSVFRRFAFVFLVLAAFGGALAVNPSPAFAKHKTSHRSKHVRAPVSSAARYADIVIDARTGRIFHASNPDALRHPASLTKMMTIYITLQAIEAGKLRLDQRLPVSANAAAQSPTKLGLRRGQYIRVDSAIMGLITESANDAAVVLGEAIGGSEEGFGQLMTRQANALGMTRSVFHNPSGLPDPRQVTTARDMAILGAALVMHYPQFYEWFSHKTFTFNGIVHHNHNHLMERYNGMDGIKTGYIRAAGFNLVSSAVQGQTRLIGVVLGGKTRIARDNKMSELLDDAFALASAPGARIDQNQLRMRSASVVQDDRYVALPSKVAAVFSPANGKRAFASAAVVQPPLDMVPQRKPEWGEEATAEGDEEDDQVTASPGTNWGIQVGAYTDESVARMALANMLHNMPQLVGDAEQILQKVATAEGSSIYRARFMGMEQRTAKSICSYMVRNRQSCLVVAPNAGDEGTPGVGNNS